MHYLIMTLLILSPLAAYGEERGATSSSGLARAAAAVSAIDSIGAKPAPAKDGKRGALGAADAQSIADSITGGLGSGTGTTKAATAGATTTSATGTSGYDQQLASLDKSYEAKLNSVNNGTSATQSVTASSGGNQATLADGTTAQPAPDLSDPAVYASRTCMSLAAGTGNSNNAGYLADCICNVLFPAGNRPDSCKPKQDDNSLLLLLALSQGGGGAQQQPQAGPPPDIFVALPPPCEGKKCKQQQQQGFQGYPPGYGGF